MPVPPWRKLKQPAPTEEFVLSVGGVAYRARRYAQVVIGGGVVCGYLVRREASDKPYLVTANACSCDHHRYRHVVCKHMEAVRKLGGRDATTSGADQRFTQGDKDASTEDATEDQQRSDADSTAAW